jgi:hypothetical protein
MSKNSAQQLLVEMVMRQTNYSYEEADAKLLECNNNYLKVIRESMGINKKEEPKIKSINQQIYTEIRGFMDNASKTYREKQELEKKREKFIEEARIEYENRMKLQKEGLNTIIEDEEEKIGEEAEKDKEDIKQN